jgi:hypothetical protein
VAVGIDDVVGSSHHKSSFGNTRVG